MYWLKPPPNEILQTSGQDNQIPAPAEFRPKVRVCFSIGKATFSMHCSKTAPHVRHCRPVGKATLPCK